MTSDTAHALVANLAWCVTSVPVGPSGDEVPIRYALDVTQQTGVAPEARRVSPRAPTQATPRNGFQIDAADCV